MKIYNYDQVTGALIGESNASLDPLETQKAGEDVFLLPAHATTTIPPDTNENEIAIFSNNNWSIKPNFKDTIYYEADGTQVIITDYNIEVPENTTLEEPSEELFKPLLVDGNWTESALIYYGVAVETKADVDNRSNILITDLNEAKAKTEKILAGSNPCPIWDEFVEARQIIIDAGNLFVTQHNLT